MKTFVFGIIFLGFTNLVTAQQDVVFLDINNEMSYSKNNSNNKFINQEYVNHTTDKSISKKILKLQNIIANYNIISAEVYNSKANTTYTVTFTEGDNFLEAIYDENGILLSSHENYQAIKLPYEVSSKLIKDNPGWALKQVYCNIKYTKGVDAQIVYRVVLNNGKKTKKVTINI
ncbi:hypothetical protein [Xanthomarina sp. F2636L]|uniref:hypothetical protein n=1 Tax=Xanthomarina sp. F2636L TaxID=2996018 RepID=UPI00225DF16B|nr:hypothetical protein [Xanthomarina sp. F2636L]MCX7549580.1 hypothetical protein [Xanthomarina sp. F2636L]